jgi:hypothetical protein
MKTKYPSCLKAHSSSFCDLLLKMDPSKFCSGGYILSLIFCWVI